MIELIMNRFQLK